MELCRTADWLAVDKPWDLSTHAPRPGILGAAEWLELHRGETVHIVSRLDRATSGVLLLARNPAAAARAEAIHEAGGARKIYELLATVDSIALGRGTEWTCDEPLDGKSARTRFRREVAGRGIVRYTAEISRGRRHQIRRHAAASGLPILGDDEHGGDSWPRLALHCREVHWPELPDPIFAPTPRSFDLAQLPSRDRYDLDLACCRERRGDWLAAVTDAWRLVHRGEVRDLPCAIDRYGGFVDAIWYDERFATADAGRVLEPILARILEDHDLRGGVIRIHRRNPHRRGLVGELQVVGEPPPPTFTVAEHGLRHDIDLLRTQHTGLFLDQRDGRRRIARRAEGARVANLFAYTCSFSVAAAAAGCEVVFSVDVARPGLNTGKTNFAHNDLTETGRGKFIVEDARRWLRRQLRRRDERPAEFRPLDLVICDPPVFASSRRGGRFAVEKEWPGLVDAAADLLGSAGAALFANNHQAGDHAFYRRELERRFAEVLDLAPPLDFPALPGAPPHVRTFWCAGPVGAGASRR